MKGIAPVVATILMLLIVIAIIGFAYTFFTGMIGTAGEQTEEQMKATVSQMSKGIWVEGASGTAIIVRTLGTGTITPATELSVLINNNPVTCSWSVSPMPSGSTSVCTLASACVVGDNVTVIGPSNTVSKICS
jgi:flagellin-like protein